MTENKITTATQVLMVSTLLNVLEFHHIKLFIYISFQKYISRYSHVRRLA